MSHPKSKLSPVGKRVLVHPEKSPEVTKGGIILTPTTVTHHLTGLVVSVGSEVPKAHHLKTGDRVLFLAVAGTEYTEDGIPFRILADTDILGVIAPSEV